MSSKELVKVPSVGESIAEVTIASWVKKSGDFVKQDEILCELESDKATVELPSPFTGVLTILSPEGETVPIGHAVADVDTSATAGASASSAATAPVEAPKAETKQEAQTNYAQGHPSPAAKKIMDEKNISQVTGSGVGGRVTKEDALKASSSSPAPKAPAIKAEPGSIRREKMTSLRKTISKRLVEAKNTTAMLTTFNEVDMSAVMKMRSKYKEQFKEKHQIGLGFMSLFTKAASMALMEFPAVNAQIDGTDLVFHDYVDMGIAVSAPKGLVVPVVRNSQDLSLAGIEREIARLAAKARDNKISIDDMQGGTFTITNGGVFGSMLSTPIINIPQSAILGMHNIVERPTAVNGEVVIRPIMYLALSYDHRIIDGRESVSFLKKVKELIEDPARMLLEV